MSVLPFSQRVIAGTPASVEWQLIDGTGEPANPGTVTVTVTRADGTALATDAATSGSGTAARTYALTAAQTATLDRLTVAWKASGVTLATTEVDVVAAPWFSNAELRAAETSLGEASKYTAAKIAVARLQVESFFEKITHRRFVPGYALVWLPGVRGRDLVVPHPDVRTIRSAALYDDPSADPVETLAAGELAAIPPSPAGVVSRYSGTWNARWVRIGFEWGFAGVPADVKRQAQRLCREVLVNEPKGSVPDNASSWSSTELGWSAVLVTPGVRGAHTRLPSVNECLDTWTFAEVGLA